MRDRDGMIRIRLGSLSELDPQRTFECGQCFRWNETQGGAYLGVAGGFAAVVETAGREVWLNGTGSGEFWENYFDLERDYAAAGRSFKNAGEYMEACAAYGAGIRILRQDAWEALCSFIISQCNNIPRIKGIIETMCRLYGEPVEFLGERLYAFPTPARIAALPEDGLAALRCGYRAPYILAAARAVHGGEIYLQGLARADRESAVKALSCLPGVGRKVASCAALYGLGIMSGFPVDTWMKRALAEHFPKDFDPDSFGEYAGLAQQYIFHYARNGGRS